MWQNVRERRLFIPIISVIVGLLLIATGGFIWYALTRPPVPPQATCGTVTFLQGRLQQPPVSKDAPQVENCFAHTYQNCSATSMQVTQMGVDTSGTTIYWPYQKGSTCQIYAQWSYHVLGVNHSSSQTVTCQGVLSKNGGLLFQKCGTDGDVFIAG